MRAFAAAWGPVVACAVVFSALGSIGLGGASPRHADKLAHALQFGLLAWLVVRAIDWPSHDAAPALRWVGAVAFTIALGALDEWAQAASPSRVSDYKDLAADGVGAVVGASVALLRYRPSPPSAEANRA